MPWETPPSDYVTQPGDLLRWRIGVGMVFLPEWLVSNALELSGNYEFVSMQYEGADMILTARARAHEGPEIIQAGMHPALIAAALAAVGIAVYALTVKDFRIWRDQAGTWQLETSTSIPGFLLIAGLAVGVLWLSQK